MVHPCKIPSRDVTVDNVSASLSKQNEKEDAEKLIIVPVSVLEILCKVMLEFN